MDRSLRRRIAALVVMFCISLGTAMRSGEFDHIRTVEVLLLLSAGMCLGVALSLYMHHRKSSREMHS